MLVKVQVSGYGCEEVKCNIEIFCGQIIDVMFFIYIVQFVGISDKLDVFLVLLCDVVWIVEVVCFGVVGLFCGDKIMC